MNAGSRYEPVDKIRTQVQPYFKPSGKVLHYLSHLNRERLRWVYYRLKEQKDEGFPLKELPDNQQDAYTCIKTIQMKLTLIVGPTLGSPVVGCRDDMKVTEAWMGQT
jgi:hypothetical protein